MIVFIIGLLLGITLMSVIQISKEAEVRVRYIKDENNIECLQISKNIDDNINVSTVFSNEETVIVKKVLEYFNQYYSIY